jgi:hypothetical protein
MRALATMSDDDAFSSNPSDCWMGTGRIGALPIGRSCLVDTSRSSRSCTSSKINNGYLVGLLMYRLLLVLQGTVY